MTYRVKSPAGPWTQAGAVVSDDEFNAHPSKDKFLRTGAVVKIEDDDTKARAAADQERLNVLDRQIAELTAERNTLMNGPELAQANVSFNLPEQGSEPNPDQAQIRADGKEVLQPTSSFPVAGEVVPAGDQAEAPKNKGGRPPKVQE